MELISIKVCVIVGLLCLTFVAACLPMIFLLPYLKNSHENKYVKSFQRLKKTLTKNLPCKRRWQERKGKLSTCDEHSEEFPDDITSDARSQDNVKGKKTTIFLDMMNCFSGGVFLGTSFLALMPEIREIFDEIGITWPKFYSASDSPLGNATGTDEGDKEILMPITEILVTCGLFIILILEQAVHSIMDRDKHAANKPLVVESVVADNVIVNGGIRDGAVIKVTAPTPINGGPQTEIVFSGNLLVDSTDPSKNLEVLGAADSQKAHKEQHSDSIVRSIILVTTLSVHSLIEGLAIGLQNKASSALSIFFAVLFHKSLMAFSMGNNLLQAGQSTTNIIIAASLLAVMSPTGIGIGMVMKETRSGTEIVQGVLQGIATGTFLFITFFEVLSKEFSNHSHRVLKTIAFVLGYCCILAVMFTQHGG